LRRKKKESFLTGVRPEEDNDVPLHIKPRGIVHAGGKGKGKRLCPKNRKPVHRVDTVE